MKARWLAVSAVAVVLAAGQASAAISKDEAMELAKKSGCLACHSVEKKVVGPAWQEVGNKYKGDAAMKDKLIAKVKAGGKGVWGEVPMPPYSPRVPDADIEKLVEYVISIAK